MKAEEIDAAEPVEDRIGLDKAYAAKNNVYVEGDTPCSYTHLTLPTNIRETITTHT